MKFFILHSKFFISLICAAAVSARVDAQASPEARAVGFLAREVPRWRAEHPCYSCHNNGDATRALIAASRAGHDVGAALADTLVWLRAPAGWDASKAAGGFDNKALAHLQFAGALTSAAEAKLAPPDALADAARIVAADQAADGSWLADLAQNIGSPATYGSALATWAARRSLVAAHAPALGPSVARADRWLRTFDAKNVPDAAAIVLGLERAADADANAQRGRMLALLRRGQAPDGGWGPFTTSPSEVFDTALVVLGLTAIDDTLARPAFTGGERRDAIARGRQYVIDQQAPDGSWAETTRPRGQESYAQRISTAAWATLALLASSQR